MVCVAPHTSMNLYCRPGSHRAAIWAASLGLLGVAELVDEAHRCGLLSYSILDSASAVSSSA